VRYIRTDGRVAIFFSSKGRRYFLQKQKAAKFGWTQVYRKLHKKGQSERTGRRRARRVHKVQRSIVGMDLNEIRKRRIQSKRKRKTTETTAPKTEKTEVVGEVKDQKKS